MAQEEGLTSFLFGNVDERGRVEADYLDEDAKDALGGLAKVQGGADLELQAELQNDGDQSAASAAVAAAAVRPAADAQDFADEAELIEDAEAAAAAAAEQRRRLGVVSVALQAGAAAEEEDYDMDEDEAPATAATAAQPQLQQVYLPQAPAKQAAVSFAPPPAPPRPAAALSTAEQIKHVRLPVLGKSVDGETVLRFSELYGFQGVMAGHISSADELRPPPLLPRGQRRAAPQQQQQQQQEEAGLEDEEAVILAADVEVPAEEETSESEGEDEQLVDAAKEAGTSAAAQPGAKPASQHRSRSMRPSSREQAQRAAEGSDEKDTTAGEAGGSLARPRAGGAGLSDASVAPVDFLPWEDRVCWQRKAGQDGDAQGGQPAGGAAGELQPDGFGDGFAGQQDGGFGGGFDQWGQPQEQPQVAAPQADIAAMFQQQQPDPQHAAMQFGNGLPAAFMPGAANGVGQAGWAPQEQPPAAPMLAIIPGLPEPPAELPGLSSATAAEVQARAAAESDEEEFLTLPTAPLLRLELLALANGLDQAEARRRLRTAPDMLPVHREAWEERIAWDGAKSAAKLRVNRAVFDLNDAGQAFELTVQPGGAHQHAGAAGRAAGGATDVAEALASQAAALVLRPETSALPLPPRGSGFDASNPEEVELWRLQQSLAREREYHQQAKRKAGTAATTRVLHAKLAVDLATIPILNPTPSNQDEMLALSQWHTPRGKWWPLEVSRVAWNVGGKKGKKGAGGPVSVTITSLPGLSKNYPTVEVNSLLEDLWQHLVQNAAMFKPAENVRPLILLPGRPPVQLSLDHPLIATGAIKEGQKQVKLSVAFQDIELLPSATFASVPANDNPALLRPPNAFTRKRDFSASEPGHVVLLEYMEQQPPLLNRPGMGAKLITYYRKQDAADTKHQKLKEVTPRWRVGTVHPLGDDDDSPFLGQLAKGSSSLSVESGLYRALAYPYEPPYSDFLLLRTPAGTMQLREVNGTVMVGQELPMLRVPAPTAREVKDLEERRIYVHVFKHLRRQQAKLDKDPIKQGHLAFITLKALADVFPSRPPAMIRAYLKDTCDLAVRPHGETEIFSLKEGARPPSEAELRKKLTPEETCALEACYVAAFRMKNRGLVLHEKLDKAAIEKLRLAAEMLPPNEHYQKAARLVEQAMQSAPWTLTDAFVAHFREGKAQLQLAGAADPTGRGFGYSFVRDVRHKFANADDVTKQMAKRQAGKVQGTDADLRRMTTAQAKERLRSYGLTDEEINGLGRWTMIDMVRQLASAAAQDGTVDAAAVKFVRHQKTTLIELQRRAAEKAQQIFDKQIAVLNNTAAEDLGDQDALEAELERELAAAEEGDEEGGPTPGKKGKREGSPTAADEQRMMQEMRAEGLMAGDAPAAAPAAALPAGSGGPPPKDGPGTKRIRREVFIKGADGKWQKSHEIVYIGRDRPGALHSLYQKEGQGNYPYGFGTRTVAGRPKELRLSYAAARGRGLGRSGGRGSGGGGRGRGRGRSSKAAAIEEASPEMSRARQSGRQRKQRQFDDDILDGDELLSDDDFEYNEEAEAPYFAPIAEAKPKQPRKKKQKKEAGEGAALLPPAEAMPALPDDFAAALAAAITVRAPSAAPAAEAAPGQQQAQPSAGAPPQLPAASEALAEQEPLPVPMDEPWLPPQDVQQPAPVPSPAKPKFKIKLAGAPAPKAPQREPSPEFVYDYSIPGDEEEEEPQAGRRRAAKAKDDEDYEAPEEEGSEDEFVPDEDEILEEGEEERRFLKKARSRSRFDAPLGRSASRRSAGSARSRGAGGGGAARKKAGGGGGGFRQAGGGGGGGMAGGRKRRRDDYDDVEFEEEEEEELSDDVETLDDEEEDVGTSDEGATPPPGARQRGGGGGGATSRAGQQGAVGRQLGTILGSIVQQLRNMKKQSPFVVNKLTKLYEECFGKVPSSKYCPDYFSFVPKAQVIILPEVQKKAKAGRYLTLEQFRADLRQVHLNAVTYNTPGHGASGDPSFIGIAQDLLEDSERLIAEHLHEIESAEADMRFGGYPGQAAPYGYPGQAAPGFGGFPGAPPY